ncbi:MAG: hypothetical protein J7K40_12680 [candidate division Zixibacteria bacterium]|nr:hypothetical protein [candidate division Zixibacteria bacterium]
MLAWCAILFGIGIIAFLDSLFNYGEIFRRVNSVCFLLVSLGLLVRTSMKIKLRYVEGLTERVKELEAKMSGVVSRDTTETKPKKQPIF